MSNQPADRFRIHSVEIRDFRGISHLKLDLEDGAGSPLDLVVLAGPNGCGKTATLEAVLVVLGRQDLLPSDTASLEEQVRFGVEDFSVVIRASNNGPARDFNASRGVIGRRHSYSPQEPVTLYDLQHPQKSERNPFAVLAAQVRQQDQMTDLQNFWKPQVEYYSARREPEALGAAGSPNTAPAAREARRMVDTKRLLVALYNRGLRSRRPLDDSSPFVKVQRFWQEFTGDPRVLDVIEKGGEGADAPDAEVVLREPDKVIPDDIISLAQARRLASERSDIPAMVPIDRLSSGQMALLVFVGALLFREEPLDLLLIDEPEQHLHAEWHVHLLPALHRLFPRTQIIVATHSSDILASVLSSERFILSREGSEVGSGEDALAESFDDEPEEPPASGGFPADDAEAR